MVPNSLCLQAVYFHSPPAGGHPLPRISFSCHEFPYRLPEPGFRKRADDKVKNVRPYRNPRKIGVIRNPYHQRIAKPLPVSADKLHPLRAIHAYHHNVVLMFQVVMPVHAALRHTHSW